MRKGIDRKAAERKRRALEKKYGRPYMILRASNGEVAILPMKYVNGCYQNRSTS